ncbi:MAG: BON domain-containing protein [Bryobacteraceae bacterium]
MADRNDWDKNREREQEFDRERGGQRLDYGRNREGKGFDAGRWENEGGRYEGEREGRGNFPRYEDRSRDYQDDYRRERGEWSSGSRPADFGQRGDWGRQGSWGTYGNRPSYERSEERGPYGGSNRGNNQYAGPYGQSHGPYGGQYEGQHSGGQYGGGASSYFGGLGGFGEQGRHAGRGPKGWQRSDDRIREDVNERLTEHPQIDATEIDIQVRNGEVTVSGSVEDRRIKRMVEDLIEGVSGVKEVHNQLRANGASQQQGAEMGTFAGSQAAGTQSRNKG